MTYYKLRNKWQLEKFSKFTKWQSFSTKMTIIFNQNDNLFSSRTILSENSCHFVNLPKFTPPRAELKTSPTFSYSNLHYYSMVYFQKTEMFLVLQLNTEVLRQVGFKSKYIWIRHESFMAHDSSIFRKYSWNYFLQIYSFLRLKGDYF